MAAMLNRLMGTHRRPHRRGEGRRSDDEMSESSISSSEISFASAPDTSEAAAARKSEQRKFASFTPYIATYKPPFEVEDVPPYPPLNPTQTELTEDQQSDLFGAPLVDLRWETFTPERWRNLWKTSLRKKRQIMKEAARREIGEFEDFMILEGPVKMTAKERERRILRYRIFDRQKSEILLYVNARKIRRKLTADTEIRSRYKKRLTPYIPGTRIVPREGLRKRKFPVLEWPMRLEPRSFPPIELTAIQYPVSVPPLVHTCAGIETHTYEESLSRLPCVDFKELFGCQPPEPPPKLIRRYSSSVA